MAARYGFDFADRESSLEIQEGSGPLLPLVTGATYLPSGPLTQLTLGNGLVETRTFDPGYHPECITIPGRLEQLYTRDAEGNIRTIDREVGHGACDSAARPTGGPGKRCHRQARPVRLSRC